MVTPQNTPDLMNLRAYQRGRIIDLKNCPGHSWRNTGKKLLSYTFTNIQLELFTTPKMRHCNVMVLCMGQSHYSNSWMILQHHRKISGPNAQLYFPMHGKMKRFATDELEWNVLPLKALISLKQPAYKSSIPPAHLLGQGSFVQLCKKHNQYRHSTSPQNMERRVSEIRSRVISNSGKQSRALQSDKLSNYRLWVVLMVLAVIQK